jgi:hypothetical protein
LLKSEPQGQPQKLEPAEFARDVKYSKVMLAPTMKEILESENLSECLLPNYEATRTGNIEYTPIEETAPPGEWGRACTIGAVEGKQGTVRLMESLFGSGDTRQSVWKLPEGSGKLAATTNTFHYSADAALVEKQALPCMGYLDVAPHKRPVNLHPNNRDAGKRRKKGKDRKHGTWVQERDGQWHFELDFSACSKNRFYVGLARDEALDCEYITVGKITAVNAGAETFTRTDLKCTKDPWSQDALVGAWNASNSKASSSAAEEDVHHDTVILYFANMNKNGKLPKGACDAVNERAIKWRVEGSEEDAASEPSEESEQE